MVHWNNIYQITIQSELIGFPLSLDCLKREISDAMWILKMSLPFIFFLLDYKAFEEAAEHFQPYIKFFATFDKGVST